MPLSAAEALCSGGYHRCSLKYEATQQSTRGDVEKQTIYCPGRRLSKEEDKNEKSGFFSSSFDPSFTDLITETGEGGGDGDYRTMPDMRRMRNNLDLRHTDKDSVSSKYYKETSTCIYDRAEYRERSRVVLCT